MSQIPKSISKIFIFASLLFVTSQALAGQASSLYDVEILVADESADTRWRVFKEGLNEVFIRISGDSIVMDKLKQPPASRYVKQYSYDPVEEPVSNEKGDRLSHRIKIQYNGSAMEKYLLDNGFPVWGEHRTELIVWMAIRDGRNEYVLKDADQSLLKSSAEQALLRRGIPDRWPLYDYKDRKVLKVADIRGGFKEPVTAASKRYGRGPSLTGSLIWNGSRWQSSWSLLMENGNRHWSIEDPDYGQLINKAIDQAADAMGIVYAIHDVGKNQKLAMVQLNVQAVNSISRYRKLENYLAELTAVEMARPVRVDGQSVVFEITLRSREEDFLNLIKNDAELVEVKPVKVPEPEPVPELGVSSQAGMTVEDKPVDGKLVITGPAPGTQQATDIVADATDKGDTDTDEASAGQPEMKLPQIPVYYYRLIN